MKSAHMAAGQLVVKYLYEYQWWPILCHVDEPCNWKSQTHGSLTINMYTFEYLVFCFLWFLLLQGWNPQASQRAIVGLCMLEFLLSFSRIWFRAMQYLMHLPKVSCSAVLCQLGDLAWISSREIAIVKHCFIAIPQYILFRHAVTDSVIPVYRIINACTGFGWGWGWGFIGKLMSGLVFGPWSDQTCLTFHYTFYIYFCGEHELICPPVCRVCAHILQIYSWWHTSIADWFFFMTLTDLYLFIPPSVNSF